MLLLNNNWRNIMRILLIIFICLFSFLNCTKKENVEKLIPNNIETEIKTENIQNEEAYFVNENYFTLSQIRDFIRDDLNITKYSFDSIDEILAAFNFIGNYNVLEFIEYYPPADSYYNVYNIEWDFHRIRIEKYDYSNYYYFNSIEITLNKENYLDLFPYRNIEKYMLDDNFGRIFSIFCSIDGLRSILYGFRWENEPSLGGDIPLESCMLKFNNGSLYSILFDLYSLRE